MVTAQASKSAQNQTAAQPAKILPDMSHEDAIALFTRSNGHVTYVAKDGAAHAGTDALNAFIADRLNKAASGGKCPVSMAEFLQLTGHKETAKDGGGTKNVSPKVAFSVSAQPRAFTSGSFGFWGQERVDIDLGDGRTAKALCQLTVTLIGSKDAPRK